MEHHLRFFRSHCMQYS